MIDLLAALTGLLGAPLVSSSRKDRRFIGFLLWIISDCFWCLFAWQVASIWMFFTFGFYLVMSLWGAHNNDIIVEGY